MSKVYRHYAQPIDRLREFVTGRRLHVDRHSVSDLSFNIGQGEVVGIIGQNGAGKSTLLKMIAGRLEPSSGHVVVNGSVAAILELGSGFHPDLSGRENIRVGGLCMGLTKRQIEREMDNIIAFSELEEVIDMPFRTYSTGMQARLTFATAITVDPDILIIDEALSVGDNRFQLKSFNRIQKFKEAGKTIVLVTHSMASVTTFCDRVILLDKGKLIADGEPNRVTSIYHHLQFGDLDPGSIPPSDATVERNDTCSPPSPSADEQVSLAPTGEGTLMVAETDLIDPQKFIIATLDVYPQLFLDHDAESRANRQGYRYGDRKATIAGVTILDAHGRGPVRQLTSGATYQFVMDCVANEAIPQLYCGFLVRDLKGDILFGTDTDLAKPKDIVVLRALCTGDRRRIILRVHMWLAAGDYFITGSVATQHGRQSDTWFDAFEFRVVGTNLQHTNSRVNLEAEFTLLSLPS